MSSLSVYLDTNIVFRLMEYRDEDVRAFLRKVHSRSGSVVSRELTLAETLVIPFKDGDGEPVRQYETFLTTGNGVSVVAISRSVMRRSAELRARFNNRTPDAIHVACALEAGCRYFTTADRRLQAPDDIEILDVADLPDWNGKP